MKCCPTCGRAMPPEGLRFGGAIRQRLFDLLNQRAEMSSEALLSAIWGSDPEGGPDVSALRAHIWYLNRDLKKYGLRVRKDHYQGPWRLCEAEGGDAKEKGEARVPVSLPS